MSISGRFVPVSALNCNSLCIVLRLPMLYTGVDFSVLECLCPMRGEDVMYYKSSNQSSGNKGVILVLVCIGLVLGLALIRCDLVNPVTSVAEFRRAEVETEQLAQQNEIDLRQYEALQEASTQAEIEKLQEETLYLKQTHEEDLRRMMEETRYVQQAHRQELQRAQERAVLALQQLRLLGYTIIAALGFALVSLSVGLSVYIARRRPVRAKSGNDVWTPERKRYAIEVARQREIKQREQELSEHESGWEELDLQQRLREILGDSVSSNGHGDPGEMSSEPASPLGAPN